MSAIEENAQRQTYGNTALYSKVVKQHLAQATDECVVLAFCADKPDDIRPLIEDEGDPGYFQLFKNFAKPRESETRAPSNEASKPCPSRVRVCRLFPRHGKALEGQLLEAYRLHQEWFEAGLGIVPMTVDASQLESDLARALARANAREGFGFLVFLDPNGNFAITHAGLKGDFRFSEWRRGPNIAQFVSLFDSLLVRSDEFRTAVEKDEPVLRCLQDLRVRLRSIKERPRAIIGWPSPEETIVATTPTGWPGVHVIGSFARQSTFYQSQVRALNLAFALLRPAAKPFRIAVIGDGIAGMTFCAAALTTPGKNAVEGAPIQNKIEHQIYLFSRELDANRILLGSQKNSDRLLHPTIYDWAGRDPPETATKLPVLNWKAGTAKEVVADYLIKAFDVIRSKAGNRFVHHTGWTCKVEHDQSGRYRVRKVGDHQNAIVGEFDYVVFAIGVGREWIDERFTAGYWTSPSPVGDINGRILIAGNGDGGLTDLAAATIANYDQKNLLARLGTLGLLDDPIMKEVARIEELLREMGPSAFKVKLWDVYESRLGRLLNNREALQKLVRRGDKRSISFCPQHVGVFRPDTSCLNRFVAYLVLKALNTRPDAIIIPGRIER